MSGFAGISPFYARRMPGVSRFPIFLVTAVGHRIYSGNLTRLGLPHPNHSSGEL